MVNEQTATAKSAFKGRFSAMFDSESVSESIKPTAVDEHVTGPLHKAEKKLWQQLRGKKIRGTKFSRKENIGAYIADYVSENPKLVITLEREPDAIPEAYASRRDSWFQGQGYRTQRFSAVEVMTDINQVVDKVHDALSPNYTQPSASPFVKEAAE